MIDNLYLLQECQTITTLSEISPDPDKKCIFPFTYNGEEFVGCTTKDHNGSYWCATELTPNSRSNKKHNLNWGFCGAGCPKGLHICKLFKTIHMPDNDST